jgi:Fe-S-cluster containining protein
LTYSENVQASSRIESGDRALIQIVDAAMAEAARKSGDWLVCRPGCAFCCMGLFAISQLDALRLQRGLADLAAIDPERAGRVRFRGARAAARISREFPDGTLSAILSSDFADDDPCPALDIETNTCDLYASRPITCRTFGPPVRCGSESVGICELCFEGATDDEIAACEVEVDPEGLESKLNRELQASNSEPESTLIPFALA